MDSGEFLGVAATLGVAHPTGYPLYALLGQLATLFPAGDPAFLINLVSAAAGAGAAFFMAAAAAELTATWKNASARAAAVVAAGVVTLAGRTLWSVATLAEVYALNACCWAALLWAALRLRRTVRGLGYVSRPPGQASGTKSGTCPVARRQHAPAHSGPAGPV